MFNNIKVFIPLYSCILKGLYCDITDELECANDILIPIQEDSISAHSIKTNILINDTLIALCLPSFESAYALFLYKT